MFFKNSKTRGRIKPLAILGNFTLICAGILFIIGFLNGFPRVYLKWILMTLGVNLISSGWESHLLKDDREGVYASLGMGIISFFYSLIL
ncbi:hypothetical protein KJK41_11930 [Bacillus haikouensis]|nr:hypothetical protein KJK41_11930 [Bacillus haikouensis]